jgi:hypothetical protein
MFQTYNFGTYVTSPLEFFVAAIILFITIFIAYLYQNLRVKNNPEYSYFTKGILVKILGAFLYYLIYAHYYEGGDTTYYFETTLVYRQVFLNSPSDFFDVFFSAPSKAHYSIFWKHQVWPFEETYFVPTVMTVIKFATFFSILTNGSFLLTTLLMGLTSFFAVWSLFKVFIRVCPSYKYNFIACFLIPSSVFWASGISKDTITLIGVSIFVSQVIQLNYAEKPKRILILFKIIVGFLLIIYVKPYVIIALLPSTAIWFLSDRVKKKFKQPFVRRIILTFSTSIAIGFSLSLLTILGESMEKFAIDQALETAVVYQNDLKSDYHKGQSFNIGTFEPTIPSLLSKIPIAAFAGIFYPLPGQVSGLIPNVSTIEGTFYILIILYLLINKYLFRKTYSIPVRSNEILNYFLMFSIMFCIMLGLSTSNFGALVRFRVPGLPFLSGYFLIHLYYLNNHSYIKPLFNK